MVQWVRYKEHLKVDPRQPCRASDMAVCNRNPIAGRQSQGLAGQPTQELQVQRESEKEVKSHCDSVDRYVQAQARQNPSQWQR